MFIDARAVEPGAVIAADLCIVGGGAAGITLAQALAGSRLDVCLLESGSLDFSWPTQSLYEGTNVGLPYFDLDVCQIRYFGGNTNGWGGWCRPLDPLDFRYRPWVEESGWPFPAEALSAYYRRAHELCQLESGDYDPEAAAAGLCHARAKLLPFDPEKLETSLYRFSPPTRFGQVYREKLRQAANIRCLLNANVLAVRTTEAANEVTHLSVGCLSGTRFSVKAKQYVLAAGGIENARLLLLSSDVAPNGLGNQNDLVGRYFMEHPHTKRALLVPQRRIPSALYGLGFRDRAVSARLSLPAAVQEREELLGYSGNIHPVYVCQETQGWLAFRKLVLSLSRSRRTDPFVRFPPYGRKGLSLRQVSAILRQLEKVTVAAFLQLLQPAGFISGFVLESKPEQSPNRDSRVTLDHARDAFGFNRVKLDWRMRPIDRRSAVRAEEIVDAELKRLGIGALAPLGRDHVENWPENLEGGWHQIGTTRMHDDPRRGVVDAQGKLHGVANLFIAGSSVFPTSGVAPPTLTIVALALRLAEHLRAEVFAEPPVPLAVRMTPATVSAPALELPLASRS